MLNRLANTTSPYLRQHAENPVDWFPWGIDALNKAVKEDKPIFLSIGYAACHWCHVMAHESFEDPDTAAIMNKFFVNIKVDREERPDLDSIYMASTVAMTGSGGWPMSVFLTPDLKPFYAGTYFPPSPRHNLPSFTELLLSLADAWKNRRDEINSISTRMLNHLEIQSKTDPSELSIKREMLDEAVDKLVNHYDWNNGGWGTAPKFPQPMTIEFLLRRHISGDSRALKPALHALKTMARGGMYDVVGGGFSRYSVDQYWRVPHFEKMLYDNAQLSSAYLHAWLVTGESSLLRISEETLSFVLRELTSPDGGFYSSLDADSEGEEGKFYVWSRQEISDVLEKDAEFFITAYGITEQGNWEGNTVLHRALDDKSLASYFNVEIDEVSNRMDSSHAKLLAARDKRIRPATDDKVITAWNGLMLAAFSQAARYTGKDNYLSAATRNAEFLLGSLRPDGQLRRSWREGQTSNEVFLEDYGALIIGLLELYQTDYQNRWYLTAEELADEMVAQFTDQSGGFFDTAVNGEKLLLRPKDLQDNATPSGNSLAVDALLRLASFNGIGTFDTLAEKAIAQVAHAAIQYPTAFARWLSNAEFATSKIKQVAIIGEESVKETSTLLEVMNQEYRPNMVLAVSPKPIQIGKPALLVDRSIVNGKPTAFVCEGFTCKLPVNTPEELREQLNS